MIKIFDFMFSISYKKFFVYKFKKFFSKKPDIKKDSNFEYVNELRKLGYCKVPNFSENNFYSKEIIKSFDNISLDRINDLIKKNQTRGGRYEYRTLITNLFDHKLLLKYATQDLFLKSIRQYFGFEPKIRCISAWLDYPLPGKQPSNSQIFHRDYDDAYLVKTFLCLTDIKNENGPFQFIRESHQKPWKKNNDLENNKNLINLISKKGDLYLADTNGLHKGKVIQSDYRAILTVHYVSPNPFVGFPDKIIN